MKRRSRLKQSSANRRAQLAEYYRLRRRYLTEVMMCEICGINKAVDIHHRRGRRGKGLLVIAWWMGLCRSCHSWIHEHPKEAREKGFLH